MEINILGVNFKIRAANKLYLEYSRAFVYCYSEPQVDIIHRNIDVYISEGVTESHAVLDKKKVHFSKNLIYWNFDAKIHSNSEEEVSATWNGKGIWVQIHKNKDYISIVVEKGFNVKQAGESIYHVFRNVALYFRKGEYGNLFHGCAVELNSKAIVFAGHSSAGKTTLMTESIINHNAFPVSNDRVLITAERNPQIVSWPGYISFCEGTIMNYSVLSNAVDVYEDNNYPYKTQSWPYPLKPVFVKTTDSKRIFPMMWLTDSIGKKYTKYSPLKAIVLSNVSFENKETRWEKLNLKDQVVREKIAHEFGQLIFDHHEDAFLSWHGLPLPAGTPSIDDLVDRLTDSEATVWEFYVSPDNLDSLSSLFEKIFQTSS